MPRPRVVELPAVRPRPQPAGVLVARPARGAPSRLPRGRRACLPSRVHRPSSSKLAYCGRSICLGRPLRPRHIEIAFLPFERRGAKLPAQLPVAVRAVQFPTKPSAPNCEQRPARCAVATSLFAVQSEQNHSLRDGDNNSTTTTTTTNLSIVSSSSNNSLWF